MFRRELAKLEGSQSDPLSASQTPDLIMAATIVIVANEKRKKSRRKSQLKGESGNMALNWRDKLSFATPMAHPHSWIRSLAKFGSIKYLDAVEVRGKDETSNISQ